LLLPGIQLKPPRSTALQPIDVAIIGAGPYGLSIAAHLAKTPLTFRIFGTPMTSWSRQMPKGMLLKSDGFASDLYDPGSTFTLRHFCAENGIPYADVGNPVSADTFVAYGLEFQRRLVPTLEQTDITRVRQVPEGFELETQTGETLKARKVVVAAGITHFSYLPPSLANLPPELVSHSLAHHEMEPFRGKHVAILGAGASAVDIAALLHESGAQVELIARRAHIAFHAKPTKDQLEPRSLYHRVRNPRSGLGLGWKSRLATDAPLIFHRLPLSLRLRAVQRHLGPAPGWFMRDRVVGQFPLHMCTHLESAEVVGHGSDKKLLLHLKSAAGDASTLTVDHLIAATGFRPAISRLQFLSPEIRAKIATVDDTPILNSRFESAVPNLYFVGLASANSFGPLTRFAYGAGFTASRITRALKA
jgi:cation diffusion facilitator CzcD-associated flavoprotein CzcO